MKDIEIILKERANRQVRNKWAWDAYYKKVQRADKLFEGIKKHIQSRHCLQEAKKQYVTAHVTAFEVYFKDSLLEFLDLLGTEKISKLVDSRFSVSELRRIIEHKITFAEVLASHFNFQDLNRINKIFSELFGVNYFEVLKKRKFHVDPKVPDFSLSKNFFKKIDSLIEMRHEFVHDINFKKNIGFRELNDFIWEMSFFILASDIYFFEQKEKNAKKQKAVVSKTVGTA